MPLNKAQIEFINSCIDHLLEFPTEESDLYNGIFHLIQWTQTPPQTPDDSNIFYALSRCLRSPELSFPRLESFGESATVHEVKHHIVDLVDKAIFTAKNEMHVVGNLPCWHKENFVEQFITCKSDKLFVTATPRVMITYPYDDIFDESGIYHSHLSFIDDTNLIRLKISVQLIDDSDPQNFEHHIINRMYHEINDYIILMSHIEVAKEVSRNVAAKCAYDYLKTRGIITSDFNDNPMINALLSDRFIIDILQKNILSYTEIPGLTEHQIASLNHRTGKFLILTEQWNPYRILALGVPALNVIQKYTVLLSKNAVSIENFEFLSPSQLKILAHPLVINLIHCQRVSISTALQFNENIVPLLNSELYADYFLTRKIYWPDFYILLKSDIDKLLVPDIANCIKENILSVGLVKKSTYNINKLIRHRHVLRMVYEGWITYDECRQTKTIVMEMLNTARFLRLAIKLKWLFLRDIDGIAPPIQLCRSIYVNRLDKILNDQPFLFPEGHYDSILQIKSDILHLNNGISCHMSCEDMADDIIKMLSTKLASIRDQFSAVQDRISLISLKEIIEKYSQDNAMFRLSNIINEVDKLFSLRQRNTLFLASSAQTPLEIMYITLYKVREFVQTEALTVDHTHEQDNLLSKQR